MVSHTRLSAGKAKSQYLPDPFEPPSLNQEELDFLMKEERDAEKARGSDDDGDYGAEEVDEFKEWRQFEADVKSASAGVPGVEFGKQLSKDELDEAFIKKFRNTGEIDDDVFPPGFFDYQDKVAGRKGPPRERLATDPVRQAEGKLRKEAEVELDDEGDARIHGCKIPSKYLGYFTDPHNYRMEKTLRYEEKIRKQVERAEKRRLTSTWKYDPDQLVSAEREKNSPAQPASDSTTEARTRRQLRVSSKLQDALDSTLDDFLRKYAPKLYLRGTDFQLLDVSIAKDMKTAKILYAATESREFAAGIFRKHSATIRYELTKAIQPQKWSPELKFVHIDDEAAEKPDFIQKRTGALRKMLEQEIRKLTAANPNIWKQAEELERTQKAAEEARKRRTAVIDGTLPSSALDSLGLASAMRGGKSAHATGTGAVKLGAVKLGSQRTKRLHRREKIEL
jgi:hypothetical protein